MQSGCGKTRDTSLSTTIVSSVNQLPSGPQRTLDQGQAVVPAAAGAQAAPLAQSQLHPPVLHMRVISCTIPCHSSFAPPSSPCPKAFDVSQTGSKRCAAGSCRACVARADKRFWRMPRRFFVQRRLGRAASAPIVTSSSATRRLPISAGHVKTPAKPVIGKPQWGMVGIHRPLLAGQFKPKQGFRLAVIRPRRPAAVVRLPDRQR